MSRVVAGNDVWPAIAELLRPAKRKVVAVAYLGGDAPDLLAALGSGDLLVCDASVRALTSGATNPDALEALLARGVDVRSCPGLHAKVYIGDDVAFVGSANASASSVRQVEAGFIATGAGQVRELEAFVRAVASSSDSTQVDDEYVDWAKTKFRPSRGAPRGRSAPAAERLHVQSYGDPEPPSVRAAAERQRRAPTQDQEDAVGIVGHSWGPEEAWRVGDRCVWVARGADSDIDRWVAEPPAVCFDAQPVGGSSKQWIYWWRTPAGAELSWANLRRAVLVRTGQRLELESSTGVTEVADAVYAGFEVDRSSGGMVDVD